MLELLISGREITDKVPCMTLKSPQVFSLIVNCQCYCDVPCVLITRKCVVLVLYIKLFKVLVRTGLAGYRLHCTVSSRRVLVPPLVFCCCPGPVAYSRATGASTRDCQLEGFRRTMKLYNLFLFLAGTLSQSPIHRKDILKQTS